MITNSNLWLKSENKIYNILYRYVQWERALGNVNPEKELTEKILNYLSSNIQIEDKINLIKEMAEVCNNFNLRKEQFSYGNPMQYCFGGTDQRQPLFDCIKKVINDTPIEYFKDLENVMLSD